MAGETVQNFRISLGSEFSRHPNGCHENSDPEKSDPENPDPENSDPLKHNLPHNERKAIKDLKSNHDINIKKADKGTTTVIMSRHDKIKEGQTQLDDLDNYRPLEQPMVEETAKKA